MKAIRYCLVMAVVLCLFSEGCSYQTQHSAEVVICNTADPKQINPIIATDAIAQDIDNNIFQPLLNFDYRTLKLVPVLANSLPKVKIDSLGRMLITFEIRKEAKWDNGTSVTAKDVEFTLKAIKNTSVNDEALRSYYDMVGDVILYPNNPKKITIVCDYTYMYGPISIGTNTYIIPEYLYDSAKYLENFTIKQMHDDKNVQSDPKMIAFAKEFNSDRFSHNPNYISGSGAYKFTQWITGQRVILEKKKDWWGNSFQNGNCFFEANASKLTYTTINDMATALVSLKAGNVDVMYNIKPQDFIDLPKSEKFASNFNAYAPLAFAYSYIGINMANTKFRDIKTRQAMAHLVSVEGIIKNVYYNYARQVIGPITPTDSLNYDYGIKPFEFNIDTAKRLLAEAGWKDSDGDGVLDKVIDGKKINLTIDFLVNVGSDTRKKIALIFQEEARKAGVEVNIVQQDYNVFLDNLAKHNFEMYVFSWVFQPGPQDFKQIFHSSSAQNGGSNFISFGNTVSDAVIDSIRTEMDENKRAVLYKKLQQILHEQCGYIFISAPEALIAINKKFTNAYPSSNNPFYWEAGFKSN